MVHTSSQSSSQEVARDVTGFVSSSFNSPVNLNNPAEALLESIQGIRDQITNSALLNSINTKTPKPFALRRFCYANIAVYQGIAEKLLESKILLNSSTIRPLQIYVNSAVERLKADLKFPIVTNEQKSCGAFSDDALESARVENSLPDIDTSAAILACRFVLVGSNFDLINTRKILDGVHGLGYGENSGLSFMSRYQSAKQVRDEIKRMRPALVAASTIGAYSEMSETCVAIMNTFLGRVRQASRS